MINLTMRQLEVLSFINTYRATEQCNPTAGAMCEHFRWASPNSFTGVVKALVKKGALVKRSTGRYVVVSPFDTLFLTEA